MEHLQKSYRKISVVIFLFLLFQLNISAQDNRTAAKDTTSLSGEIEEVTIAAFRTPYNLFNTPAPINLVSPEQLELGNALTPVEALNQVPGVLMHHGTLNTNRLTIRGIGARTPYSTNKIKAYFGDIPLTSGDGETTLEDLENTSISKVEIIKGPSSSLYGAGLAGVILFHPKSVKKTFIQNQSLIGSFGTLKNTVSTGAAQKNLNVFAMGSTLQSEGFRENNKTSRLNLLLNGTYSFSEKVNMQVLLKATKMNAYIPSSLDLPTFENTPEKAAANWKNILGYEEYMNGQFGISLNYLSQKNEKISAATFGSFRNAEEQRPFNLLDEFSDYLGWRAYAQKNIRGKNHEMIFTSGLEFFREKYNWSTFSNQTGHAMLSDNIEKRQYENLFLQMESNFARKYFISAGINGNLTRFYYTDNFPENGDQSGQHSYQPVLSPRLGVNVVLSRKFSMFANISHGFSTPTFEETLYPEGSVNADILPESGTSTELGFRSALWGKIQFSASYYRIFIKNLLVARRTGEDAYIGVNAGSSVHPGFETELKWQITKPNIYPSVSIAGNATVANYHFTDFVDLGVDYKGKNLPGTSKFNGLAMVSLAPVKSFQFNFWHRLTGKMPVNDANTDYTNAYGLTSAELEFDESFGRVKMKIKGGVQNLLDVKYASMLAVNAPAFGSSLPRYYYPGAPRNYFVSLLLRVE